MKKIAALLFLLFMLFGWPGRAEAGNPAYVTGYVRYQIDGRTEGLGGVVLFKERTPWTTFASGQVSHGVFSISQANGYYGFVDDAPVGHQYLCGHDRKCAGMLLGAEVAENSCSWEESCGLSCNEGENPFRILAYFPKSFDWSSLPAGVSYTTGEMKGGGRWDMGSPTGSGTMDIAAGTTAWQAKTVNFGNVTYQAGEWLLADSLDNVSGIQNINIGWVPKEAETSLSCTDLTRSPVTAVQLGDGVTFTCSHAIEGLTFSHYQYRIHLPSGPANPFDPAYWTTPTGWDHLTGSTPVYQLPASGTYAVQCRVCASNGTCTAWGE